MITQPAIPDGSRRDRGSATVLVLAVGLVLLIAGLAGAALGAAQVARHRAQTAADLAALAGAARAVEGTGPACARAGALAAANHARLLRCARDGWEVTVTVAVTPAAVVGPDRVAVATARAGPVTG